MISDFQNTFEEYYDPNDHDSPEEVINYGYYYMGSIICTKGSVSKIIDGQQRLTSLTLLLIYLTNLQKELSILNDDDNVDLKDMIFSKHFGKKSFNIDVPERENCMKAILDNDKSYKPENESSQNLLDRYDDIVECFPEELKIRDAFIFFTYWLIEKVLLLKINTPSEDEAHTIFLTMNDRGLSLNSAEMMKAYIIQQVAEPNRIEVNHHWQNNINRIKNASTLNSSGIVNTEDVEFISTWLRAKYAETLREGKRGAKDEDYELLGEKFHSWVKEYARSKMNLTKQTSYKDFVTVEMTKITDLYLRLKTYSSNFTTGYEDVFYNANRDLTYQIMLVLSAVKIDDSEEIIQKKIKMTAKFVDIFASTRIFNFKKVNWNTNKYLLFQVMKSVRNKDCKNIGMIYIRELRKMGINLEGITKFSLNQFSSRYMLHFLARFTSYVNELIGNPSHFYEYIDRNRRGNTYDIEHIIPDKFEDYSDKFIDFEDFQNSRQYIGNLIILTRDKNRSYQAMKYTEKVKKYAGDNILAQALNSTAYDNNPQFLSNVVSRYGFKAIEDFNKDSIVERTEIYLKLARDIWNPKDIKDLAGGWTDNEEKKLFKDTKNQEYTVGYANRSWTDALKYGFLSADIGGSGRCIYNIQAGDTVFCHIIGKGFVGIGECINSAVPMEDFTVEVDGKVIPIEKAPWHSEEAKEKLDKKKELFVRVKWEKFVDNIADAFWEKGLTTVPLAAYTLSDKSTYKRIKEHFGYNLDNV